MKKLLAVMLMLAFVFTGATQVHASTKPTESRAIAIVFDNSGSMYDDGDQAWCRATYAMEVFASMLNEGDILQIYPMHPIMVNGTEYTMEKPFQITDASKASQIREILTPDAGGTPIESIDCATSGLKKLQANKKYLVILTDGGTFSKNNKSLSPTNTKNELDARIQQEAGRDMTVMYLGIGSEASVPNTGESEYFVKKQAVNTEDVLAMLTDICNRIFGRDTMPKNHISGNKLDFDISMNKLIVFVQGENIENLKLSGGSIGNPIRTQQTKYSTAGASDYKSNPDTSLQGMIVTYEDCDAGNYTIEYSGTADSIEVYYEPNADLDFVFTDAEGSMVDYNALYEGDYKVSFGMKDAKTGQLIESDLLGQPHYYGNLYVNDQPVAVDQEGYRGEVPISLKMGDTFGAELTVNYLNGYIITKDFFGWPEGGLQVSARPAGELSLEITGGDSKYMLQDLEEGTPYIAKVYYQGEQLTGSKLESVKLKWQPETSNAEIKEEFAGDHYKLTLHYKDPNAPQNTACGECTVDIYAFYTEEGSTEAQTQCCMTYKIEDDFAGLQLVLKAPEDYLVIKELPESQPLTVALYFDGKPLTAEEFAAVQVEFECGGIEHTVTPNVKDSTYTIKLNATPNISEGDYTIKASAEFVDHIGRVTQSEDAKEITLSKVPAWVPWIIRLGILLILAIIAWIILHIRVLPKYLHTSRNLCNMVYDGDDVTKSTNFMAELKQKNVKVQAQYAGKKFGVSMDVTPGKESYLYKSQKQRSAEVKVPSVRRFGPATIQDVLIGSVRFVLDDETGKLVPAIPSQKSFNLTNGMMVKFSGTLQDNGLDKEFEVIERFNFKKK